MPSNPEFSSALSGVGRGLDEPLLVAHWCAMFLAQPPDYELSPGDRARVHGILVRNLAQVQSLLDDLRDRSANEDAARRARVLMEDKLEEYILDIEGLLTDSTVEEGKLRDALADGTLLEVQLRMALGESVIHEGELRESIESRDVTGQAQGILMEREGANADEAFQMLEALAQRFNMKVGEVSLLLIARTWAKAHPEHATMP